MNDNQVNPNNGQMPQMPMDPQQYMQWYQQQMNAMQQQMAAMQQQMPQQMMQQQMPQQAAMPQQPMPQMQQQMPQAYAQQPMPQAVTPSDAYAMPQQMQQPVQSPAASQPMMVNGQLNDSLMVRDPNVLNFMAQAVREKHKDKSVTEEFIKEESERLYDEFGQRLVEHFEPMLSKDQIAQFDGMLQSGSTQEDLLQFLMSSIPDLTQKIEQVLLTFKDKYLMSA